MTARSATSIATMFDRYQAAVYAKDVDAFVSLYAENVRIFDMWGQWSYQGRSTWREMVVGWFGSLGAELCTVHFDDIQTHVSGDVAGAHALVRFQAQSASGEAIRAMDNRISWILKREAGGWSIVHEHSSAPLNFENGQVTLQR